MIDDSFYRLERQLNRQKKRVVINSIIVLVFLFALLICYRLYCNKAFEVSSQLSHMVEGVDYFYEPVKIVDKKIDIREERRMEEKNGIYIPEYTKTSHYELFYSGSDNKIRTLEVSKDVYNSVYTNGSIKAYTTDHNVYSLGVNFVTGNIQEERMILFGIGIFLALFELVLVAGAALSFGKYREIRKEMLDYDLP